MTTQSQVRRLIENEVRERVQLEMGRLLASMTDALGDPSTLHREPPRGDEVRENVAATYDAPWRFYQTLVEAMRQWGRRLSDESGRILVQSDRTPEPATPAPVAADLPSSLPELKRRSLGTVEMAERLGVNPSRVRQRLLARTLYGFKDGRDWWIPEFQLVDDEVVPGIEQVFPEIEPATSPLTVARWFVIPWADLVLDDDTVLSPRDWLLQGRDPRPVIEQARVL